MARITGRANPAAGYNPGRVPWVDVTVTSRTASAATVRFQVGSDPGSGSTGTFSGTLKVNSASYAVSGAVSGGSAVFYTKSVTYNQAAAFTLSISLTGSIPGTSGWQSTTLSGTFKVPAGSSGSVPGAPTNLRLTNRDPENPQSFTLKWDAVSGATSYLIRASQNGGSWYDMTTSTTTSKAVEYTALNIQRLFNVRAVNAAGTSVASEYLGPVYGQPSTPGKPTLKDVTGGVQVTASSSAAYRTGRQIERMNPAGAWDITGTATSWVDSGKYPLAQYRVRDYAGDGDNRAYSTWSAWSESALAAVYKPPAITALKVVRANSSGTPTQMGTYLRVTWSGKVESVKDGTTELNKMTRKIRWRKTGASAWTESVISNGVAPAAWTNAGVTVGAGQISVTDTYEVEVEVKDAWQTTIQATTISTASVALSLSKTGVGASKVWQQGALDVGGDAHISGLLHLADPNVIVIGGVAYQASGSLLQTTTFSDAGAAGLFYRDLTLSLPDTPPSGWEYSFTASRTGAAGAVWVVGAWDTTTSTPSTRVYATAATSRDVRVRWQLVKL